MVRSVQSPYSRPEEDPVLLLHSTLQAVAAMLRRSAGQAMRRCWIAVPYGEEEITRLEEEVIPVLRSYVERIDEIDRQLEEAQEAEWAIEQARRAEAEAMEAGAA
jgi:hypothetical protein